MSSFVVQRDLHFPAGGLKVLLLVDCGPSVQMLLHDAEPLVLSGVLLQCLLEFGESTRRAMLVVVLCRDGLTDHSVLARLREAVGAVWRTTDSSSVSFFCCSAVEWLAVWAQERSGAISIERH